MSDKILDNLYLGTWEDGLDWKDETLNVRDGEGYYSMTFYISLCVKPPEVWSHPHCVSRKRLDLAVDLVEWRLNKGKKLLVHCLFGKERSVLVVAHYLARTVYSNLDAAYDHIKAIRPIIEDRREWVNHEM